MNKAEYADYVAAVKRNSKSLEYLSSGSCPGCKDCGLEDADPEAERCNEPHFSWSPCDLCRRAEGGDREYAHGFHKFTKSWVHLTICADCVYFLAYGRLDDQTMVEVEGEKS